MGLSIEPFLPEYVEAVRAFNRRLEAKGSTFRFPDTPVPTWLPPQDGIPVHQEYYLVRDQDAVRGGYILKPQAFWVNGSVRMIADYRLPVSEGIVDPRHAIVGMLTLKDALKKQPLLFGLGMGSPAEPVARLLKIFHFPIVPCPFYFRIIRPKRFLEGIAFLRRSQVKRKLLDLVAASGAGWVAMKTAHRVRNRYSHEASRFSWSEEAAFGSWADAIWESAKGAYALCAVRSRVVLDTLYPADENRFSRLKVSEDGMTVGWAVVLDTCMRNHRQFGNLRVGSIVDCLGLPGREAGVIAAATRFMESHKVDLIVSNQLQRDWCNAFEANGYLHGPTNFYFAVSPALGKLIEPLEESLEQTHMTRGDGDGPINL